MDITKPSGRSRQTNLRRELLKFVILMFVLVVLIAYAQTLTAQLLPLRSWY